MTAAAVNTRRISAGITPSPGSTSLLPSWWGATDWLENEVAGALDERPEVLRDHHVSREAVLATARGMAHFADHRTGRDCRPTNDKLVQLLRCSLSTIQRARRALKALGLVVELIRGRSIMTRSERLQAWRRGSSHRRVAATFALCSRPRRAPKRATTELEVGAHLQGAGPHPVEGDTPPGALKVSTHLKLRSGHLRRQTETSDEDGAPRRAPTNPGRAVAGVDPAARRLAEDVRGRLGWLRGVSARRMTPTLSRFARAGWTARDVERAVVDALGARGWRLPRTLKQPAAYLAGLLRPLDPADRPTAAEDALRAAERAENAHRLRIATTAVVCPHGQPGGHLPSPVRGWRACPACRAEAAAAPVEWPAPRIVAP